MKYFVIEAAAVNYDAIAKAITEKEDRDSALMLFHQIRASQLANKDLTYGLAEVIDEAGGMLIKEWSGSTVEPEPVPEINSEPTGE
ncbi:MAG: hypothetical protein J6S67_05200 [Methanobrevibacter sp.]|nr:hypothetical protein [Methanobrevibacter sp.]